MRKLMSVILVLVLMLSLACPAFAESVVEEKNTKLSREELTALACEVFPEYASKITSLPVAALSRSTTSEPTVVCCETRKLSEDETITYTELSSGVTSVIYNKAWYEHSSSQSGNIKTVTGDFSVICNLSLEELYICDFVYCINSSGYDYISSYGTDSLSDCSVVAIYKQKTETASSNAYLEYRVLFAPYPYLEELGYPSHSAIIRLVVGDNTLSTSVNGS